MQANGRLLTEKEKAQINAPLFKNTGTKWDLHALAEYVNEGYAKLSQDEAASKNLHDCMMDFKNRIACS